MYLAQHKPLGDKSKNLTKELSYLYNLRKSEPDITLIEDVQ